MRTNISIIGSGNVAQQLGPALKNSGYAILEVCSRNVVTGKALANKLKTSFTKNIISITDHGGIIIIAVNDDSISDVVNKLAKLKNTLVVHTSGATDIVVLKKKFKNCGVIWQIQTIKARTKVDFKKIPIVIEASNSSSINKLNKLANSLSKVVYSLTSSERRILHLSAVWVNNFPNHLFLLAKELLEKHKLPYKLLAPLMQSTFEAALADPSLSQTGPAKRNDKKTMKAHLHLLNDKNYRTLYKHLSKSITNRYK